MVKLLFDENISFRIVKGIQHKFPESTHVHLSMVGKQTDHTIFSFARDNGFTLVTSDGDFQHIQMVFGFPPKVIWLRLGNTSTLNILNCILGKSDTNEEFVKNSEVGTLEIY
ncbi:MAG: DUF5615 family PIN-like protein [Cyclobacteriaceae bacterium]|jgi:predicted nuclease of predicted toxin-antitoxin system|nr:DUF5615 family PIN-like protein [Flammeovirgaceae bacterium]